MCFDVTYPSLDTHFQHGLFKGFKSTTRLGLTSPSNKVQSAFSVSHIQPQCVWYLGYCTKLCVLIDKPLLPGPREPAPSQQRVGRIRSGQSRSGLYVKTTLQSGPTEKSKTNSKNTHTAIAGLRNTFSRGKRRTWPMNSFPTITR